MCNRASAVSVNRMSFLRCICPQFDKVYQSGVSAIVNASGKLPQGKEVYEEFLMEVGQGKQDALACSTKV